MAAKHGGWDVASTGFASTTRLASSNPPMRRDIMLANLQPLLDAMDKFAHEMQTLRDALERQDSDAVQRHLEASKSSRDQWIESAR